MSNNNIPAGSVRRIWQIGGMSCAACAAAVEKAVRKLDGISDASVNLITEKLTLVSGRDVAAEDVVKAVQKAGFTAELLSEEHPEEQPPAPAAGDNAAKHIQMLFAVGGMSCAACSAAVEKAVGKVPGVAKASVNLIMERLTV
ncbi:MAG: copper ion binding protein, partial [Clostridia bacterium]|nr:copper ion binding protein [Clostridia bacterium]